MAKNLETIIKVYFKALSPHYLRETEESHEKLRSG
jgi:hypothetical protein